MLQTDVNHSFDGGSPFKHSYLLNYKTFPHAYSFYLAWEFENTRKTCPFINTIFTISLYRYDHGFYYDPPVITRKYHLQQPADLNLVQLISMDDVTYNFDYDYIFYELVISSNNYGRLKSVTPLIVYAEPSFSDKLPFPITSHKDNFTLTNSEPLKLCSENILLGENPFILDAHFFWYYHLYSGSQDSVDVTFILKRARWKAGHHDPFYTLHKVTTKVPPNTQQMTHLTWVDDDINYADGTRFIYELHIESNITEGKIIAYNKYLFRISQLSPPPKASVFANDHRTFEPITYPSEHMISELDMTIDGLQQPVYLTALINWDYKPQDKTTEQTDITFIIRREFLSSGNTEDIYSQCFKHNEPNFAKVNQLQFYDDQLTNEQEESIRYSLWLKPTRAQITCVNPTVLTARQLNREFQWPL